MLRARKSDQKLHEDAGEEGACLLRGPDNTLAPSLIFLSTSHGGFCPVLHHLDTSPEPSMLLQSPSLHAVQGGGSSRRCAMVNIPALRSVFICHAPEPSATQPCHRLSASPRVGEKELLAKQTALTHG